MRKTIIYIILICFVTTAIQQKLQAASQEQADIYLEFSTWKQNDMSRTLKARVSSDSEDGEYYVEGISMQFFTLNEEEEVFIGEAISGADGFAALNIPSGSIDYTKDEDDYIIFYTRFAGSDAFTEAEEELMVKDVTINFRFEEEEEEKLIYFEGLIHGAEGDIPLGDDDLFFYVPRMFSDMKIADGWFEEDGTGYIEFPQRIIGDSIGNILVIARLEDHYDYGNVEVSNTINWAVPKVLIDAEKPTRELWTPIAPLWMIITLIIMLVGVWGHYFYAIIQLIMIKRSKS